MSPSESKIHVAVVGAGIAGLAIAAALRRCPQYTVTVYERRAAHLQEPSAGFGICDHGVTVLKKLGIHRKDVKGVMAAGEKTSVALMPKPADGEVPLWLLVRQDLREALLRRLAVVDETLTPIEVVFDANVTTVEPEIGTIHWSLEPMGSTPELDPSSFQTIPNPSLQECRYSALIYQWEL
ncbi:Monooxygenase FAD-binding [Colletotrichum asianum]